MGHWVDLRDEHDRLFGRLDLASMRLESKVNGYIAQFDLLATLCERRAVVVKAAAPEQPPEQPPEKTGTNA